MADAKTMVRFTNSKSGKPYFISRSKIVSVVENWNLRRDDDSDAKAVIDTDSKSVFVLETPERCVELIDDGTCPAQMVKFTNSKTKMPHWFNRNRIVSVTENLNDDYRARNAALSVIATCKGNIFVCEDVKTCLGIIETSANV